MTIGKLQANLRLARRFQLDAGPGDEVLLEFVPDPQDQRIQQWAAEQAAGTGITHPLTLQIRMRKEVAKEAFTAPGETYTLTIERTGRGS